MNKRPLSKKGIDPVPNIPGVYEILDKDGNTLYVGKSNHLRDRLEDHLGEFRSAKYFRVRFMQPKAAEKVENRLIKERRPKYNIRDW